MEEEIKKTMEGLEYNTERSHLIISEYGRNIHKMIDYLKTIEDRDKRSRLAAEVVTFMAQLTPQQKEITDYKHKLWDQLHIIANYELDIDSPYPVPNKESLERKPDTLNYPKNDVLFMHYGFNLQKMIDQVSEMEDGKDKDVLVKAIANCMKKLYLNWNRESVDDNVIHEHLAILSDEKLAMNSEDTLQRTQDILARNNNPYKKRKHMMNKNHHKNNRFNNRNNRNNNH